MRVQPIFYDNWFRRYWIFPILALFCTNWANLKVLQLIQPKWVDYLNSASKKVWKHKFLTFHSLFFDYFQNYMNLELWRHQTGISFLEREILIFTPRSLHEKWSVFSALYNYTNIEEIWELLFFTDRDPKGVKFRPPGTFSEKSPRRFLNLHIHLVNIRRENKH